MMGSSGCLVWTIVLIPLAIPLFIIGLVLTFVGCFIKAEPFTCPACQSTETVEPEVNVMTCEHCGLPIKRTAEGWIPVSATVQVGAEEESSPFLVETLYGSCRPRARSSDGSRTIACACSN